MSEEMTLERLEEVLRREREGAILTKIDENFFVAASGFMERLGGSDDFFIGKKLEIARRYIEEIVSIRSEKILSGKKENALPEEHKLIKLSEEIVLRKAEIIAPMLSSSQEVKARVKKSIPQFVGPDMETYGPYEVGQIITLSTKVISLLSEHDYVEKVS